MAQRRYAPPLTGPDQTDDRNSYEVIGAPVVPRLGQSCSRTERCSRSVTSGSLPMMHLAEPGPILVVDDDADQLALYARHLTRAGYEVLTSTSGREALQSILDHGPTIILTDWCMDGMDGPTLCRAIRSHEGIRFAYVIMMSAAQPPGKLHKAVSSGADDLLPKPFAVSDLLAKVRAGERIVFLQQDLDRRNREMHRANAELAIFNQKLEEVNARLERMATTDELTGLINRREGMNRLHQAWAGTGRHTLPLACMAIDIDHFKRFNDDYGHETGDIVLKTVAQALQASARKDEVVCRMGGEEFLVICPHAKAEEAAVGAERLRAAVEATHVCYEGKPLSVTASIGVAERTVSMTTPDDLLRVADTAMYLAKGNGRNMVVCTAQPSQPTQPEEMVAHSITMSNR